MKKYISPAIECIEIHTEGLVMADSYRTQLNVSVNTNEVVQSESEFAATAYRTNLWE